MLKDLKIENFYIVCGHTDMRKSIDGLASIIQQQFQLDLFTNSAFLFCGRRRNRMKVLLWEDDGFLLLYKRLEDGKFNWPRSEQEVRNIVTAPHPSPSTTKTSRGSNLGSKVIMLKRKLYAAVRYCVTIIAFRESVWSHLHNFTLSQDTLLSVCLWYHMEIAQHHTLGFPPVS